MYFLYNFYCLLYLLWLTVINYNIILYGRGMILNHESGVTTNIDHFDEHFFITKVKVPRYIVNRSLVTENQCYLNC